MKLAEIPILELENFLVCTIQRELHDRAAEQFQDSLVTKLGDTNAKGVLIDITALDIVDSFLGRLIGETARMCKMMGAKTVLTGISPAVAITLTELGIELKGVHTTLDMDKGLAWLREETKQGEEQ